MLCPNCSLSCPPESLTCDCGYDFASGRIRSDIVARRARELDASRQSRAPTARALGALFTYWACRTLFFAEEGFHERDFGLFITGIFFVATLLFSVAAFSFGLFFARRFSRPADAWLISIGVGVATAILARLTYG